MSDLMTGSSGYATGAMDTATTQVDNDSNPIVGEASAAKVNGITSAIVQIETILGTGTDLKGSKADLVTRLATFLNPDGTIKATTAGAFSAPLATTVGGTGKAYDVVPTGTILPYAGSSAPTGFLLCDGSAVSRTTYATLFALVSTTYGSGDGSTTFNVPDLRGRVIVMVDGAANRITSASTNGANADTLGGVGGAETHTLTTAQIPSHTHSVTLPIGAGSGANQTSAGSSSADAVTSDATGGGAAHSNTQPWMALNYMLKY